MTQAGTAAILLAALAAACGHARSAPDAPRAWPAPPAAPRAVLAGTLPSARPPERAPSWIARGWRAFLGVDAAADRARPILLRPFGVTVTSTGAVVVADPDAGSVVRFEGDRAPRAIECPSAHWSAPLAVTAAPDGAIWVADGAAATVVRISPGGACTVVASEGLERPAALALSGDEAFVADPPRHAVVVLGSDGRVRRRFGDAAEEPASLAFPTGIAAAPDGTLVVVDALHRRVIRFSPEGRFLASFGEAGEEGGAFSNPRGIAVDAEGRIFVSDADRDAILVFSPAGAFEFAIGWPPSPDPLFSHPAGLAIQGSRLFVADSMNARIVMLDVLPGGRT